MTTLITRPKRDRNKRAYGLTTFPTFSNLFEDFFNEGFGNEMDFFGGTSMPAVNIKETDSEVTIEMAVPGMKKSDFNIDLEDSMLTISAEERTENEDQNENYTRKEFGYRAFRRSFNLPETVDADKISAKYTEGVLFLNLPKKEEVKNPVKTIKIS